MNGDGGVAHHGFGPRRRHGDELTFGAFNGIFDVSQRAFDFFIVDFLIGNHRLRTTRPVAQTRAAINQTALEPIFKNRQHRLDIRLVHGETLALPIVGATQRFHLFDDGGAILVLPTIDALDKCFAAQRFARQVLAAQQRLNFDLRGDAGVIGAGHHQSRLALHAMEAGQAIVNRVLQGVAQMQNAGHVGRRNRHHKRSLAVFGWAGLT